MELTLEKEYRLRPLIPHVTDLQLLRLDERCRVLLLSLKTHSEGEARLPSVTKAPQA